MQEAPSIWTGLVSRAQRAKKQTHELLVCLRDFGRRVTLNFVAATAPEGLGTLTLNLGHQEAKMVGSSDRATLGWGWRLGAAPQSPYMQRTLKFAFTTTVVFF